MIIKRHYSPSLREAVLTAYFTSHESCASISQRFGIPAGTVSTWILRYKHHHLEVQSKSDNSLIFESEPVSIIDMSAEKLTPSEQEVRIKELEKQLEEERMRSLCLNKMIDIAERDLDIVIRKKYGAKQSKK